MEATPSWGCLSGFFEGTWRGTILASGSPIQVELRIANRGDGTSTGSVVSRNGTGVEIPVTIVQTGKSLTIGIDAVGASYSGTLNDAATELAGSWSQQSVSLPLTLTRVMR